MGYQNKCSEPSLGIRDTTSNYPFKDIEDSFLCALSLLL